MQRLVDDLLTLSALEGEQNAARRQRRSTWSRCCSSSRPTRRRCRTPHRIVLDIGDPAMVTGSRDELASAFGNLVSNAVRYTPDGGTITLGWHVDEPGTRRVQRRRHGDRHRARAHSPADGALLPRRSQPLAGDGRHGSRTRDRQARAAAAPGRARRDERARPGKHVHVILPASEFSARYRMRQWMLSTGRSRGTPTCLPRGSAALRPTTSS